MPSAVKRDGWIFAVAAAMLVLGVFVEAWVTDDALIAFRYADHIAAGHGPVFNPGERVEGFSSPFFVALLVPAAFMDADLFVVSQVFGALAALVEVGVLFWFVRECVDSSWAALAASLLFATDRVVVVWSTGGLETATFGALVLATFCLSWRPLGRPWWVAAVLVAVATCRPEGVVFSGLGLLQLAWAEHRRGHSLRPVATCAATVFAVLAALVAIRFAYYGVPLPNTYYAKMGGLSVIGFGQEYVASFVEHLGWSSIHLIAWVPVAVAGIWSARETPYLASLGWVAAGLVVVGIMGGDYMNDFRLLRPYMGLIYLSIGVALAGRSTSQLAAILAVFAVSHGARRIDPTAVFHDAPPPEDHKRILTVTKGTWNEFREALERLAEPGDALLVDWAGYRGYGHPYRTIDSTGLVSTHLDRDFYLRATIGESGLREAVPGHARWPEVAFMQEQGFAFIFPKVNAMPPSAPEIHDGAPARHQGYPFVHVTVPLENGRFFRFFTTMGVEEVLDRGRRRQVGLCVREPWQEMVCQRGVTDEAGR